ncbi:hypothetical protein AALP_AA8G031800 [Arabis alpina]|uniref:C2H2-type domain-containing protein n=1 Tax=Arabis alpina TaxID=50452 RepID=A0A087G4P1_ARAAL|nr:hypothetical protein AALP_AA8G031800 [Arabis alpina]
MEFWGVEVTSGASLSVDPGEGMIMHISQVALGKNETNENESVQVYLKVGYQKLLMGTLSHDKFPNLSTEIVLEEGFEWSHSWKNGSVYFTGYKVDAYESDDDDTSDDDEVVVAKGVRQVNFQVPNQDVKAMQDDDDSGGSKNKFQSDNDTSSDDDSEDTSSDDDSEAEEVVAAEAHNDEEAEDDSSHDDEDDSAAEDDDDDDDDDDDSADDDDDDDSSDDDALKPRNDETLSASSRIFFVFFESLHLTAMEFWGVEVKSGVSLPVNPGEGMIVHISQVALGKNETNEKVSVRLSLKVGGQKLVIGTLSHEKFPQLSTEIVLERSFELSHNWKNGSVYFSGYKVDASEPDDDEMADGDEVAAPRPAGVKQVNFQLPAEDVKANQDEVESDDDTSSDDSSSDDSETEEVKVVTTEAVNEEDAEDDSDDDEDDSSDEDEDDSSDEETPKKAEEPKKRSAEASTSNNAVSNKKAKFVTPQKSTESKKPHVHIATPHPSKGGKNSASNGESSKQKQTPKSAGAFGCNSCNRTFTSETGLQSHTKAKHSAAA